MVKIRYFRIKLPKDSVAAFSGYSNPASGIRISVLERSEFGLVLRYAGTRIIQAIQILEDGSELRQQIPTTEQHSLRLFFVGDRQYLSVVDPPRGTRLITDVLSGLGGDGNFFFESLAITKDSIDRHISRFAGAKLVSAKVRDFQVSPVAVGRLEITSKEGLPASIAEFLEGKYYKIDSLTYEAISGFQRGLITYNANGTIRVSEPLVGEAFPAFEQDL